MDKGLLSHLWIGGDHRSVSGLDRELSWDRVVNLWGNAWNGASDPAWNMENQSMGMGPVILHGTWKVWEWGQ